MRLALLFLLLTACGPSYWSEQEEREAPPDDADDLDLLDMVDEEAEEPWVPPGADHVDPSEGLSWPDFVDQFAKRYCESWELCYGYEYPSCRIDIEDIFIDDGEDCDYDIEEGGDCVIDFEEAGCNAVFDIGSVDACDRLLSECTVGL